MNDRVLPVLTLLLGIAIVVRTLVAGGGATSVGLLFGVLLAVAGALRHVGRASQAGVVVPDTPHHRSVARRTLGSPALFAIVYTSVAAAIYFSLGVVADHALGVTPFVFLFAGVMFVLAAMTYVEGSSLHQDRGGSTVFARYAFNELWSFIAGWAILLDYTILIAVTAFSATNYLAVFHPEFDSGSQELVLSLAIVGYVVVRNIRGFSRTRVNRITALVLADIALQVVLIVLGLIQFFDIHELLDPIHLGTTPQWDDVIFAGGVAVVVFTGLESASGLAGEVGVGRAGLKRLIMSASATIMIVYVGIATVALTALPVRGNATSLSRNFLEAPMLGIAESFPQHWLRDTLKYVVAAAAAATLVAAANSAMLGLSRLAYSLSTNRQIPSRARPAAPDALDAVRADRDRRGDRGRADRARRTSTSSSGSSRSARCWG